MGYDIPTELKTGGFTRFNNNSLIAEKLTDQEIIVEIKENPGSRNSKKQEEISDSKVKHARDLMLTIMIFYQSNKNVY